MKNKKAQQTMSMPFGMIFAIFLIVVFVVFAFMAVGGFLDLGKSSSVGLFYEELQGAVDNALQSQSSETTFEANLPEGITQICFANLSATITSRGAAYNEIEIYSANDANTFLVPPEYAAGMEFKNIKNLDIETITEEQNPYCVNVNQDLKIIKDFYSRGVVIQ